MRDINKLVELCEKFVAYSKDRHPGLSTWQMAVARLVEQIGDEAINVTFGEQKTTMRQINRLLCGEGASGVARTL